MIEKSSALKPKLYKKTNSMDEDKYPIKIETACNEKVLDIERKIWEDIFLVQELSSNWNILLTCLLQKIYPDCLIHLEDPNYNSDSNVIFSAKGCCQITQCTSKFSLFS